MRSSLKDWVRSNCVFRLRSGEFILSSGERSDVYIDLRRICGSPRHLALLAEILLDRIDFRKVDFVAGIELGSVPLAAAVSVKSVLVGRPVGSVFVRKEPKRHGVKGSIVGADVDGKSVFLIDDVATTGSSVARAVEALRSNGAQVVGACIVVDREGFGIQKLYEMGVEATCLFSLADLA